MIFLFLNQNICCHWVLKRTQLRKYLHSFCPVVSLFCLSPWIYSHPHSLQALIQIRLKMEFYWYANLNDTKTLSFDEKARPCQELLGTQEQVHLFDGTMEQKSNFEGSRQYWGTRNIRNIFWLWGNRGTCHFISGKQGNRYPLRGVYEIDYNLTVLKKSTIHYHMREWNSTMHKNG